MHKCINHMKVKTFQEGSQIIERGSIGTTMFFIDIGTVCAQIRGQTLSTVLSSGDYFGEIAFMATCKKFLGEQSEVPEQSIRVADVVATSECRMLELSVKDFVTVMQGNPGSREILDELVETGNERKANAQRVEDEFRQSTRFVDKVHHLRKRNSSYEKQHSMLRELSSESHVKISQELRR